MADPWLETERLNLRTARAGDIDVWMQVMNTPTVMLHLGGVKTRQEVEEKFARTADCFARNGFGFWIVEDRASGALVGNCGLGIIENPSAPDTLAGQVQVGWSLAEAWWRRGLATEAAREVLANGFDSLGLERVYAQTSQANRGSWRLMEKLGMERMPRLDYIDPEFAPEDNPTIVYSIGCSQ